MRTVPLIFVGKKRVRRTVSDRYGLLDRTAGPPTRPSAKAKAMKEDSLIVIKFELSASQHLVALCFFNFASQLLCVVAGDYWLMRNDFNEVQVSMCAY